MRKNIKKLNLYLGSLLGVLFCAPIYSDAEVSSKINIKEEFIKVQELQNAGKDEEALKAIDRVLFERVANSDALYLKGVSLRKLGKVEDAKQNLEEALWFSKNKIVSNSQIQLELAKCYIALDKKDKALETLQKAIALDPQSSNILLELGRFNLKAGNRADAILNLRSAVQFAPSNPEIKVALAEALLSGVKRGSDQSSVSEARDISKQLVESLKTGESLWRSSIKIYSRSLIELGELNDAEKTIKKALKAVPQDPDIQRLGIQLATEQKAKQSIPVS